MVSGWDIFSMSGFEWDFGDLARPTVCGIRISMSGEVCVNASVFRLLVRANNVYEGEIVLKCFWFSILNARVRIYLTLTFYHLPYIVYSRWK